MTEIDFIPGWYQAKRNRKMWYQRQIFIICLAAFVVILWCVAAGRGLSQARAELNNAYSAFESGIGKIQQHKELSNRYQQLQKQAVVMDYVVPRTSYSAVLAELSRCIGPEMVVKKLDIHAEPVFPNQQANEKTKKVNLVAASADKLPAAPAVTQTCVVVQGYAVDARQVAVLISSLEQSDYFFQVLPTYSKNQVVDGQSVTDFEIRCVLADYELFNESR